MTLLTELASGAMCHEHEDGFRCRTAALRVLVAELLDDLRLEGEEPAAAAAEMALAALEETLQRLRVPFAGHAQYP